MDAEIICTMTQGIRDKARVDEIQRRCCMLLEQGKSWEYISAMVQLMANKESVFMKQGLLDLGADFEADMERAATYVEKNVQKLTEAINVIKSGRRLSGEKKKLAERLGQFTTSSEASEALYTDLVDMRERFRNIGAYPDLVAAASMWDGKSELDPVEMARSYSRSAQEQAAAEANMTREEWEEAQAAKAAKQAAEAGTGSLFGSMSIREETRSKARELDALAQSCTPSLTTNSRRAVPLIKATPQAVEEAVNARRPEAEERWNEWLDDQKEYEDLTEQELADLIASKDESIEETLSEYEKEEQERLDIEALSEWDEKREEWAYETQELIADELRHRGYNVDTDRSNISSSFYITVTHPSDAEGEHALKIRFSDHVDKHGGNDLNVGFGSVENMVEKAVQFAGRELPQVEGGGASFSKRDMMPNSHVGISDSEEPIAQYAIMQRPDGSMYVLSYNPIRGSKWAKKILKRKSDESTYLDENGNRVGKIDKGVKASDDDTEMYIVPSGIRSMLAQNHVEVSEAVAHREVHLTAAALVDRLWKVSRKTPDGWKNNLGIGKPAIQDYDMYNPNNPHLRVRHRLAELQMPDGASYEVLLTGKLFENTANSLYMVEVHCVLIKKSAVVDAEGDDSVSGTPGRSADTIIETHEDEIVKEENENGETFSGSVRTLPSEVQSIIDKAKADGTYMLAPNGKRTNLTEHQWAQVRTQAFKAWFGDWEDAPKNASKVLDENRAAGGVPWNRGQAFQRVQEGFYRHHDAGHTRQGARG